VELEWVHLLGLLREKENAYLGSSSWTQRTLGGHLELQQGTGLHWAGISLWGTKGPFIRPRCIGTDRARTQMLINQFSIVDPFSTSAINLSLTKISKSWSMILHLLGKADEDLWPCGYFAARARKQVCSFVCHCQRQSLCGHRTAQEMKHVAFGKTQRWNNRLCARWHLKQNKKPLRFQPLVRAGPKCFWRTRRFGSFLCFRLQAKST
jgi:hypothetical protein